MARSPLTTTTVLLAITFLEGLLGPRVYAQTSAPAASAPASASSPDAASAEAIDLPSVPSISAVRIPSTEVIRIDGYLNETSWQGAPVGGDFVMRVPSPGSPEIPSPEFRVLYDAQTLYLGIRVPISPGEPLRITEYRRDATELLNDDALTLKFDVMRDQRTTIGFRFNAAGTQQDFMVSDNGLTVVPQLDMIWDVRTRVTETEWISEVAIPFVALGLPNEGQSHRRVVGLNIAHSNAHAPGQSDWSVTAPEFGGYSAPHYGLLEGLTGVGGGIPVSILPYASVGYGGRPAFSGTAVRAIGGGEILMRVGDSYWVQLTGLTDSAQVELDDPAVNLDRFPLFFPERRSFFLTGIDAFRFGREGVSQPFFSRRVGLDQRARQTWVYGGIKAFGRLGRLSLGAFDVVAEDGMGRPINNAVLRPRVEIGGASYFGAIVAVRHGFPDSVNTPLRPHVTAGLDTLLRTSDQRIEASAFSTFSFTEGSRVGVDGEFQARYLGANVQPQLIASFTSPEYAPELGFVRRTDFVRLLGNLPVVLRARDPIREVRATFSSEAGFSYATLTPVLASGGAQFDLDGRHGWGFTLRGDYVRDRVATQFTLPGGVNVPPGDYGGPRLTFLVNSAPRASVYASLKYVWDAGFFGGSRHEFTPSIKLLAAPHFRIVASGTISLLRYADGREHATATVQIPFTWTPSTAIQLDTALQLNTNTSVFTSLVRLRWRYAPGSDAFIVYRQDTPIVGAASGEHSIVFKLTYRWDGLV